MTRGRLHLMGVADYCLCGPPPGQPPPGLSFRLLQVASRHGSGEHRMGLRDALGNDPIPLVGIREVSGTVGAYRVRLRKTELRGGRSFFRFLTQHRERAVVDATPTESVSGNFVVISLVLAEYQIEQLGAAGQAPFV